MNGNHPQNDRKKSERIVGDCCVIQGQGQVNHGIRLWVSDCCRYFMFKRKDCTTLSCMFLDIFFYFHYLKSNNSGHLWRKKTHWATLFHASMSWNIDFLTMTTSVCCEISEDQGQGDIIPLDFMLIFLFTY